MRHNLSDSKRVSCVKYEYLQQGNHDTLMQRKGYYFDLVRQQERSRKDDVHAAPRAHG